MSNLTRWPRAGLLVLIGLVSMSSIAAGDDESIFADMLRGNVLATDLSARVRLVAAAPVKTNGVYRRYWIETEVLEVIEGNAPDRLIFYHWSEEPMSEEPIGQSFIVNLDRNSADGQYYVPDNGYIFPDDADLLPIARAAAVAKHRIASDVSTSACRPGTYAQPGGDFALRLYCDDALGTNIAVELARLGAPRQGDYDLTHRTWQGGDWAGDVTSFVWASTGDAHPADVLYVATSPVHGTGAVYRLDLKAQKASRLWVGEAKACYFPLLVAVDDEGLGLRVTDCDGGRSRDFRVSLQ